MPNDTGPVIGIDLGTTNSCVGVFLQDSNSCEILANSATGLNTTPSWVGYYDEDGKILIGRSARTAKTFVYDAKRMIGRSFDDAEVSKNSAKWPFKVERGSNNRCVIKKHDNTTVNVEEISQHVLMAMKQLAEARMQTEVKRAVITVPAYFNNSQIQATKDAARGAGLHTLRIMDEPTAAILAAGMADSDVDKLVLVFDWGGGTFDISILEITDAVSTEAKNGNMDLGGRDLDEALVDYCLMKFKEQNGGLDLSQDKNLRRRLFEVCEAAKIALSAEISYEIKVEQFHDNKDLILTISRDQFETIGQPIFQKLLQPMTDALKDAGVDKDEIDEVVLVGGSTLIPKVRSMIKDFFSNEDILNLDLDPDEAVAVGATLQAGILAGQDRDGQQTIVKNCIPLSIGIKLASGDMSVIIKRNTRIPIEAGKMYYTAYTNQNEISINVKQGEAKIADSNHSLGTFYLRGIPDGPAGSQKVHVNFRIDSDCTLHVTMKTMHNNEEIEKIIKPQDHFALTEEEVTQMIVQGAFLRSNIAFGNRHQNAAFMSDGLQ